MNLDLDRPGRSALALLLGSPIVGFGFAFGWHLMTILIAKV